MADIARAGGRGAGMSPSRIVLISGNSLCHNPRVMKAATALARSGYDVHVLGAWLEADLKARDQAMLAQAPFRFEPVFDATLPEFFRTAAHTLRRARRKAANTVYGLTGWQSRDQLGYGIGRLLARARALPRIFISRIPSPPFMSPGVLCKTAVAPASTWRIGIRKISSPTPARSGRSACCAGSKARCWSKAPMRRVRPAP